MVEYAFMLAFIAMVCVVAVAALGVGTRTPFQNAAGGLERASGTGGSDASGGGNRGGR